MNIEFLSEAQVSYISTQHPLIYFLLQHPWIAAVVIVWATIWKIIALWKAAKNNHLTIFIVLSILSSWGVAEIIYLVYLKMKSKKEIQTTE